MHSKAEMTREEEAMIQYCRDRLDLYIMLEKKYGHEKACKILSLYDLERSEKLRLVERRRGSVEVSEAPTGHFIHLPFRFPQPHKQGDGKTDEAKGKRLKRCCR